MPDPGVVMWPSRLGAEEHAGALGSEGPGPANGVAPKRRAPGPQAQGTQQLATDDNRGRPTAMGHPPRSPASSLVRPQRGNRSTG
jgi:hypothetical protein